MTKYSEQLKLRVVKQYLAVATAAAGEQIERWIEPMPKGGSPEMPKVAAGHARAAALAARVSGNHTASKARRKA